MPRRSVVLLAAALIAVPVLAYAPAAVAATTAPALVIGSDFPDPDVIRVGGTYYAYSTNNGNGNVPVATSTSLTGPWTRRPDAMPTLGAWANGGLTWAPDVSQRADGRFLLYYTARSRAVGRQCIGAALATSPLGPFAAVGAGPLVCNGGEGGDIDASSFVDTTGARYLLYKDDGNAIGQPTSLWLQGVAADGVTLQGGRVELLRSGRPEEAGIIEAPVLTRAGGRYVLFYSLGGYGGDGYQTSYASAAALTGPYTKAYRSLLTTSTVDGAVRGPGGADVVGDQPSSSTAGSTTTPRAACTSPRSAGRRVSGGPRQPGAVRGRARRAQPLRGARDRDRLAGPGRGIHRLRRQLGRRHRLRPTGGRVHGAHRLRRRLR